MRRIFPVIAALVILISCAVPAFASTDGSGRVYYAPLQIDSITTNTSGAGGPFEWPFNYGNLPTEQLVYFSLGGNKGYGGTIRDGEVYGQITCSSRGITGSWIMEGDSFTLRTQDKLINPLALLYGYQLSLLSDDGFIATIQISATLMRPYISSYGEATITEQTVRNSYSNVGSSFDLGEALYDTLYLADNYDDNGVYVSELTIYVRGTYEVSGQHEWQVFSPQSGNDTSLPNIKKWFKDVLDFAPVEKPDLEGGGFEFGKFLANTVSGFFSFEIVPGFTLGHIFYVVLGVGLLLWFITLLI